MIIKLTGDLIELAEDGKFDIIVHGCNCFNTMGGGIARAIRTRHPGAAAVDMDTISGDVTKLGNWTVFDANQYIIINAYTQYKMSTGSDVFEYDAFDLILRKLYLLTPRADYGFPLIGMGLAKGNASIIWESLENFSEKVNREGGSVTVVTLP